jgi:glutamate synthase domain-containing protein 1
MDAMMRTLDQKDISGCAISGILSESGQRFGSDAIVRSIANMHERSNGLGGGFAAYGIYPDFKDHYAIHLMCDHAQGKKDAEAVLAGRCAIHSDEPIPVRPIDTIPHWPILHRYFVTPREDKQQLRYRVTDDDTIVQTVMTINARVEGAYVFSSGRNMGVFKGVGYPEDIAEFFRLDDYKGYMWLAHGRFPTNTTGWWGGAHPFGLLDWAVVHNGEISSYGINRRYLRNFGYECSLQTDTEVITYLFDLLMRKHGLPLETACMAMAPPFWSQIARMDEQRQRLARAVRTVYGGALLNGPFSIVVGTSRGMIAFNDRIKLRPMAAARKGEFLYVASEEAAIHEMCDGPDCVWHAEGGVPIVGVLESDSVGAGADSSRPVARAGKV